MKLNFSKQQGFPLPARIFKHLNTELEQVKAPVHAFNSITFNFKDESYSARDGGYHPVEIRLEKQSAKEECWQFNYITDFSYIGSPYPELVKEIDVCFSTKRVYSLYGGWLGLRDGKELLKLFIDNFVDYCASGVYSTCISFD